MENPHGSDNFFEILLNNIFLDIIHRLAALITGIVDGILDPILPPVA